MSATLDAHRFAAYFGQAPIIRVSGRQFPVSILYASVNERDAVEATVNTIVQIHLQRQLPTTSAVVQQGDVLAFLPGQEEIDAACSILNQKSDLLHSLTPQQPRLKILPLYAALPHEMQLAVFAAAESGTRKVILATNIAETSITLPNVVHVIDCGLTKVRTFDDDAQSDSLLTCSISKAEAWQRAGRAGRVREGVCYRLYSEEKYEAFQDTREPEIRRADLRAIVLWLKALHIDNVHEMEWIDEPSRHAVSSALRSLATMNAIDTAGKLTSLGSYMSRLPLKPLYARALIVSAQAPFHCQQDMLAVISMLSSDQVWMAHQLDRHAKTAGAADQSQSARHLWSQAQGDHVALLNAYNAHDLLVQKHGQSRSSIVAAWCKEHGIHERALVKARKIHEQLRSLLMADFEPLPVPPSLLQQSEETRSQTQGNGADQHRSLRCCLAFTMAGNIARRSNQASGVYVCMGDANLASSIHPSSTLHSLGNSHRNVKPHDPEFIVFDEIVKTSKRYMRNCTVLDPLWVEHCGVQRDAAKQLLLTRVEQKPVLAQSPIANAAKKKVKIENSSRQCVHSMGDKPKKKARLEINS